MSHISVIKLVILALTCFISVQFIQAYDLPILHPDCNEYEDASQPSQLPHPDDCNKFYKCSGGFAFTMNCPLGLHWSVKYNRCEFPGLAGCGKSEILTTTTTSSSTDVDKGIMILDCPDEDDPNEPTLLPYPGDCTKFFKCEVGKAYALKCPLGLHWSASLNRCEWPDIAECAKEFTRPSTQSTTSTSDLVPHRVPTTAKTPTPTPAKTPTPTTSAKTSAPTTAKTSEATPAKTSAPSTTASNPATTPPQRPSPTSVLTPSPTPAPTARPSTSATNLSYKEVNSLCKNISSAFLSYPGNCERYIRCVNGVGTTHSCPGQLFFNSRIGVCTRTCG